MTVKCDRYDCQVRGTACPSVIDMTVKCEALPVQV